MTSTKNYYNKKCKGCQIISRLIKTNYLESSKIELFSGREKNKFIQVKIYNYKNIEYKLEKNIKLLLKYINSNLKNIEKIKNNAEYYFTENKEYNCINNSIKVTSILKNEKFYN